jgi:hypothetical protein
MASRTLRAMSHGGIFDQIGGGLHRYATDREWKLPHFEKMLVDQAFLLTACADAFKFSREAEFSDMAARVAGYVLRDMTAGDDTFFSSEDADSEGVEGRFYLWSWDELKAHLLPEELDHLEAHWHTERGGNVDDEASGRPTGLNHLYGSLPVDDADAARTWKGIREKLMAVRERRERPLRDEKVLTDWNGAMIASLAGAGRATGRVDWIQAAERAAHAILTTARREDGRLHHAMFAARSSEIGFLDDYAFLVMGLLELFEATGDAFWLDMSVEFSERMIELFWEEGAGSFFLSEDGNQVPVRQRNLFDSAYPAGASIAARNLLRLDALALIDRFRDCAVRQIEQTVGQATSHGFSSSSALSAADFAIGPVREIVVVRGKTDNGLEREIDRTFLPSAVVIRRNPDNGPRITGRMPHLAEYGGIDGGETVYICADRACDLPVTDLEGLRKALAWSPEV